MKSHSGYRFYLSLLSLGFVVFSNASLCYATIRGQLIVHNSRNETITVEVYNAQSEFVGSYSVGAHATYRVSIQDQSEGMDWFDAYDAGGRWIKRGSAEGVYQNFDWWVD